MMDAAELSAYAYSYPHKSSYGPLQPPIRIADAWSGGDVSNLSLYIHIPFCEMRCGFCNLFTRSQPEEDLVERYLDTLLTQMKVVRASVPKASFAQFAVGGGTPTFLEAGQLERLFEAIETNTGQQVSRMPTSVETSPTTATIDRLAILAHFGVQRISLGVQSFSEAETRLFGRPQNPRDVHSAIETIRQAGAFDLNLDLIYGHPEQSRESWQYSLQQALQHEPEELYLYPLYIRPQTGLAKAGLAATQHRSDLYREARDLLTVSGYEQISLRCFRRPQDQKPTVYACQRDGMIGLGCGARSYTRKLHYATRFAVTQPSVHAILREWTEQTERDFEFATHGLWLSEDEQIRRYVILSLLQAEGLSRRELAAQFPDFSLESLEGLDELRNRGWLTTDDDREVLTPLGLEHSDEVGPMLYSPTVRDRLREFTALHAQGAPA